MRYYTNLFSPETHEAFSRSDRTVSGFRAKQKKAAGREPTVQHRIAAVRDLLLGGFTADDLRRLVLCTSRPALQPLAHELSSSDGLSAMVEKTVTYCQTQDCIPDLLVEVKKANPRRYAQYEGNLLTKG